ncbi:MAG: phenylacetate-CoA oxygenase/reductase subunit PaaK [Flavisolibacter sp.]
MIHFHSLRIQKIKKETDSCVSITFEVPLELKQVFSFTQGQNIAIRKIINDTEVRRNYSICTAPFDDILTVAIKKVEGGTFSSYANEQLQPGNYLEVMPPMGNFYTPLKASQKKKYVAFAAGSGITPIISIIKTTLALEPASHFTLVYGNRTKNNIVFKEQLEALKDRYIDRFGIFHILSREKTEAHIQTGRIDREKLNLMDHKIIDFDTIDEFFLCGPNEMIFTIKEFLREKMIPEKKIHYELFTVPGAEKSNPARIQNKPLDTGAKANVRITLDGIMFDFDLSFSGEAILDAALKRGANLPYACKGGVCTTCRALLKEGKVSMDVNWGLEPEEVKKGFILTCQSHPISEKIVIDFDAK